MKNEIAAIEVNRKSKNVKKRVLSEGKKKPEKPRRLIRREQVMTTKKQEVIVFAWFALKPMQTADRMSSGSNA